MFDFPNSPTGGQQVTGANGVIYSWDGVKWVPAGSSSGVSSFNTRSGAVMLTSGDVTGALTYTPYNSSNPSGYQTAAQVTASLGGYLPLAGGAMSGQLSIPAVANLALGGGTLGQVLTTNGAGSLSWTTVAGTLVDAPSDGQYYSRRNAGWAVSPGGLVDAPVDGTLYARKSGAWSHVTHSDVTDWATYVPVASSTTPLMNGAAAVGTGTTYARADHVHPIDTNLYSASNPAGYQTAAQVSASISAAAYTLPTASTTVLGGVKVDGSSITIAGGVISTAGGGGLADAPNDATLYARKSAAWSHVTHNDITDWAATLSPYALTSAVPVASSTTPAMDGAAAIGVGTTWARADHIHPTDTSRYAASNPSGYQTAAQVTTSLGSYLGLAGGTMTGPIKSVTGDSIDGAAGTSRTLFGTTAGVARWGLALGTNTAEGGSNAGSDFLLNAYTDAGAFLSTPLSITRATGAVAMKGTSTNDSAAAGNVGEIISSNIVSPGVTLSTGVGANVTSISLPAGDWDVSGEVWHSVGAGGATQLHASIGTTSGAIQGVSAVNMARNSLYVAITASTLPVLPLRTCRMSLSATTTIYLVAQAAFPSGASTAYGNISARRMR